MTEETKDDVEEAHLSESWAEIERLSGEVLYAMVSVSVSCKRDRMMR